MIPIKRSGDPLYAREVNELSRRAGAGEQLGGGGPSATVPRAGLLCDAVNDSGDDLAIFTPVEIESYYFEEPAETLGVRAVLVKPPGKDANGRLAITATPMADGIAGKIVTVGLAWCMIKTASGDLFADVAADDDDFLTGHPTDGPLEIIDDFSGPSTTAHLALVKFRAITADPKVDYADRASTASLTLSGAQTVDGGTASVGTRVLVKDGGGTAGVYKVNSGAWEFLGSPKIVHVLVGTANGQLAFYLVSGSYVPNFASYA